MSFHCEILKTIGEPCRSQNPRNRKSWYLEGQSIARSFTYGFAGSLTAGFLSKFLQDQHDAIDLTDNAIITLGNIPLMRRLRTLLLANNRISILSQSLHLSVPNLTTLVLTNNSISELGDLEPLKDIKSLKYLSLLGNPVREKKWYRDWLVWRISGLRVLDFQRIKDKVGGSCPRFATCGLTKSFRNASRPRGCSSRRTTCPTRWQPSSRRQCRQQQRPLSLLTSLVQLLRRED